VATTVGEWLLSANALLTRVGIATARLDALVLLEDVMHEDRAYLLAHAEDDIDADTEKKLGELLNRRAMHEPLAYIRNKTEFYGREFYIDHRVLEPRPESETLIDMLKSVPLPKDVTIIDVGTGSGALAITAKLELPYADVMATDVDSNALKVAERNCATYDCDVMFLKGNLLKPFYLHYQPKNSVILANLPYVPDSFQINQAAMREPERAIFGGADGLDLYREMFDQIEPLAHKPQYVLTESMPPQHELLTSIARKHNYHLHARDDFILCFTR
jgi:release factor glutamine methyltransferase